MSTLEQAAQQALAAFDYMEYDGKAVTALREALANYRITNQCGETCERAKLCYGCGKALDEANGVKPQEPQYDLSAVIHLTHNKTQHIIERDGYAVTGFVLTKPDGKKCIVDMSAVRWFDDKLKFQRMMHPDAQPQCEPVCNWTQPSYDDAECNAWRSDCGEYWTITEGNPSENGMKFCHGCGKSLAEHPYESPNDEEGEEE